MTSQADRGVPPRRVLCVVAHPDDAEIGAGGTLAKLAAHGSMVVIFCLTTSEFRSDLMPVRRNAAHASARLMGAELAWLEDGRLQQVEQMPQFELVGHLDRMIERVGPDLLITHAERDSHHDHRLTHWAVLSASRRTQATLMAFPPADRRTAAFSRFAPNVFVDVTETIDTKIEALRQFEYEGQGFRNLEIEAIRQQCSQVGSLCGASYAEAFELIRTSTLI